jgi:signal transduction histidine kinase
MRNSKDGAAVPKWDDFGVVPIDTSLVKILAVDDNEALRYSLVRSLRDAGYQVVEARTGNEALKLSEELPDLITLDVNLPDMHGFDVCKKIKANPATAHIPILHLSSTFIEPEARVQGLASGADAYLAEPIDRAELVATVGALLRLKTAETLARQHASVAETARKELAAINETLERRVGERTAELKEANEGLRELSNRLLQTQDDERKRIARGLHDSVGQLLAAIQMNNGSIEKESSKLGPNAARALSENRALVDQVMQSIRTISHLLHPPLLDELGIRSALGWYVEEFGRRSGIQVTLECGASVGRFSSELETAIFRIVQESLGNVHRHSGSPTAVVRLSANNEEVQLEVSDRGRGISAEKSSRGGVGIRGMRERVAQLGGTIELVSNAAGAPGTTVRAAFPKTPEVIHAALADASSS